MVTRELLVFSLRSKTSNLLVMKPTLPLMVPERWNIVRLMVEGMVNTVVFGLGGNI